MTLSDEKAATFPAFMTVVQGPDSDPVISGIDKAFDIV
jgi:hypothetical protein